MLDKILQKRAAGAGPGGQRVNNEFNDSGDKQPSINNPSAQSGTSNPTRAVDITEDSNPFSAVNMKDITSQFSSAMENPWLRAGAGTAAGATLGGLAGKAFGLDAGASAATGALLGGVGSYLYPDLKDAFTAKPSSPKATSNKQAGFNPKAYLNKGYTRLSKYANLNKVAQPADILGIPGQYRPLVMASLGTAGGLLAQKYLMPSLEQTAIYQTIQANPWLRTGMGATLGAGLGGVIGGGVLGINPWIGASAGALLGGVKGYTAEAEKCPRAASPANKQAQLNMLPYLNKRANQQVVKKQQELLTDIGDTIDTAGVLGGGLALGGLAGNYLAPLLSRSKGFGRIAGGVLGAAGLTALATLDNTNLNAMMKKKAERDLFDAEIIEAKAQGGLAKQAFLDGILDSDLAQTILKWIEENPETASVLGATTMGAMPGAAVQNGWQGAAEGGLFGLGVGLTGSAINQWL